MTFQQLLYFTTVVRYNSITKAAKHLFVTQPTISLSIKELEDEFGTKLFYRNNNQLELTPEGKYLNSLSVELVSEFNSVETKFNRYLRKTEILKMGIPPMLGTFMLPPILDEFSKLHPNVQMKLTGVGSASNIKALDNQEIDVAFTVIQQNQNINKNIEYIKIDETSLLFSVSLKNKFASKKQITFEEIKDTPLILMDESALQSEIIQEEFRKRNLNPNIQIRTNQLYTIKELLLYGNFGAFVFNQLFEENDNIIGIPFKEEIKLDIILAWRKDSFLPSIVKEFIDFMRSKKDKDIAKESNVID